MKEKIEEEIIQEWEESINKPMVSICCATYNQDKYIEDTINGFLIQETNFSFEILIRDDNSTDKTTSIVTKYAEKYPRLIKPMYESENTFSKGVMPMPKLYEKSLGKYIALCEGDDYWTDPLKLQKQVDFLNTNDEYVCCYHNSKVINNDGLVIDSLLIKNPKDYTRIELLSGSAFITTHTVLFRNTVDTDNLIHKETPLVDVALWHMCGFQGKAKYLSEIKSAMYRRHDKGLWSGLNNYKKLKNGLIAKELVKQNLIKNNITTKVIDMNIQKDIVNTIIVSIKQNKFKSLNDIRKIVIEYSSLLDILIYFFKYKLLHRG